MRNAFDAASVHYEGKWEGGWALEIKSFSGPVNGIEPKGECHFEPKKIKNLGPNPLPLALGMDAARIKSIMHRAV